MQKKIIALAIASALTVPAMAQAEVTVYGQANLSYDRVGDGAATNSATTNQLTSNNSRIGLKGSDDLGSGLTAMWQMEGTVAMDTGTTTTALTAQSTSLFNRNTFLGLKSNDLGTVLLGNYDTPYKVAFRKLDLYADSVQADNRTRIFLNDARRINSINYISPSFSGVTVALASVFGAEATTGSLAKGSATSLSVAFEQGPIYAALALDNKKLGDLGTGDLAGTGVATGTAGDKTQGTKVGFGYTMSQFAVNAIVENTKFTDVSAASAETKGRNIYVGGKFNISSTDAVKLAIGKKGETKTGSTKNADDVKQITVGYDHGMSKATSVYALYTKVTAQGATADPKALSFGVKHAF